VISATVFQTRLPLISITDIVIALDKSPGFICTLVGQLQSNIPVSFSISLSDWFGAWGAFIIPPGRGHLYSTPTAAHALSSEL